MKKQNLFLTFLLALSTVFAMSAQNKEYKFKVSGKLVVDGIGKIAFEGHSGSEVIISTSSSTRVPDRAKGLKVINASGLEDNTGLGIALTESDGNTTMEEVSHKSSARYTVKVPKGVTLVYKNSSVHGSTVRFTKIAGEIEAKTHYSAIELKEVTGPMAISTVHGKIEGEFTVLNQDGPVSIASSHGLIDITLPPESKASLSLGSNWGEIYSDFDIDIEKTGDQPKRYSSNLVKGTINGGGVAFSASSTHGNVYLRKK